MTKVSADFRTKPASPSETRRHFFRLVPGIKCLLCLRLSAYPADRQC